ncbi:hypothetical protein K490DRAFT_72113 [Saccharata proteae CBS 121410]|uniref:Defect at low temperature protein 1 n=1 Tax=Saccharata proteae CBS 121410 TaxID=1314787 RepID=A0A6A5YCB5_9PEZI|nr:hypothetical protein K490DRAFT_72113 [Saccharata proteae CBS 121410]
MVLSPSSASHLSLLQVLSTTAMRIPFFRIWYSTTYSIIFFILLVLLAATPADLVYQTVKNHSSQNAYAVAGVYVLTIVVILFIYASRLYTNRAVLAGIPKFYIPIEQGEVGKNVRRMIVKCLERSALIAWDSRPRDVRPEMQHEEGESVAHSADRHLSTFRRKHHSKDMTVIPIDPESPPWGHITHPGWSSPCSDDIPNLNFWTVITELPNLIEAKAVSLAPPDPAFAPPGAFLDPAQMMPDARIVALLQRPPTMGLRDYLSHLSHFGIINPPNLGASFVQQYEYARFSTAALTETQFRSLMSTFANILSGMTGLSPELVAELQAAGDYAFSDTASLALSQTSHSTGTGSAIHYKTPRTQPFDDSSSYTRSTTSTTVRSGSVGTVRTAPSRVQDFDFAAPMMPPRTPSNQSLKSMRTTRSTPMPRSSSSLAPSESSLFSKLTNTNASTTTASGDGAFVTADRDKLFPVTNPTVDGEDCLHDCESCTIKYPRKFDIDETDKLYGHIAGWSTHLLVATGKTDWVRDVADEKGSVMEAVDKGGVKPNNGKLMLSASNMPLPHDLHHTEAPAGEETPTSILLLPAFTIIDNVTPSRVPDLITTYVDAAPTNETPLSATPFSLPTAATTPSIPSALPPLTPRPCPHQYLILLCSQKTRDARCGQSAPLLRRELERHLRPLGLYRDLHDERPGGCGIYFISHVGGHKYSANVMVYRRAGSAGTVVPSAAEAASLDADATEAANGEANGKGEKGDGEGNGEKKEEQREAAQCIWLARIKPEDCENLVRYTILQGKVVKPEKQLRGGFDRGRQLVSW